MPCGHFGGTCAPFAPPLGPALISAIKIVVDIPDISIYSFLMNLLT